MQAKVGVPLPLDATVSHDAEGLVAEVQGSQQVAFDELLHYPALGSQ